MVKVLIIIDGVQKLIYNFRTFNGTTRPGLARLNTNLLEQIEYFFISYNNFKGKEFIPLGRFGPQRAQKSIKEGVKRYQGA